VSKEKNFYEPNCRIRIEHRCVPDPVCFIGTHSCTACSLLNKVQNLEVSDTTSDELRYKNGKHKT